MKDNKVYLALLGLPLAAIGIVGSVAFAESTAPQPFPLVRTTPSSDALASSKIVQDVPVQNAAENSANQKEANTDEESIPVGKATITAAQAALLAENRVGGRVLSTTLENENGMLDYAVVFTNQEVKINAQDGSFIRIEKADAGEHFSEMDVHDTPDVQQRDGEISDEPTPAQK